MVKQAQQTVTCRCWVASGSQVFFVRGLNRAKMEVLGSDPEGRTYSAFDHVSNRAYEMNEEISRALLRFVTSWPSWPRRIYIELSGVDIDNRRQLWRRAPLFLRNLEKLVSPTQAHDVFDVFFSNFEIFEKAQMRGCIRK